MKPVVRMEATAARRTEAHKIMNIIAQNLREFADAIEADEAGREVQELAVDGWKTIAKPINWRALITEARLVRIKPEPKTRPWDFTSRPREVVWVYKKGFISDRMITVWKDDCVEVGAYATVKYDTLLSEWLQRDGSPCGITEP